MTKVSENHERNNANTLLATGYPLLKEGEMYCISCKQIIKKKNLNRHDNSMKHEKSVLNFVKNMKSKTCG